MHRFHNPKLSQEGCFETHIYYASLCARCSTKKAIHSFFFEALYRKSLNTICIAFRFYNQKLSQERCFKPCAITARFTKEATDSFEENYENLILTQTICRAQDTREATNYFFRRAF